MLFIPNLGVIISISIVAHPLVVFNRTDISPCNYKYINKLNKSHNNLILELNCCIHKSHRQRICVYM